jgi:hypothetical protein
VVRPAFLAALVLALAPASVRAANGAKQRTLVQWDTAPCMTLVDRAIDPTLHLEYTIANEDTALTSDEVADSRTHQFFATCRTSLPLDVLPSWITPTDVDAALTKALITTPVPSAQILEDNTEWMDCWQRITADDDRRPITFAMADAGVDWDTSALAPGAYTVHGYTYEPAVNLWAQRPGVVKVHDGDPDAAGPAAAITTGELSLFRDGIAQIEGCVDAPAGTTVSAQWIFADDPSAQWVAFVSDAPVDGDAFALEFDPPEELVDGIAAVRATFTSPDGRSYTTMMPAMIIVLPLADPGCAGSGFIDEPCDESESTAVSGTEPTAGEHQSGESSCACANDPSQRGNRWLGAFVVAAAAATVGRRRWPADRSRRSR